MSRDHTIPAYASPPPPDHFELLAEIGHGAATTVWRARYALTGEEVALKMWRRPLLDDHERRRFNNECRRHRELSSQPHIVELLWAAETPEGNPWIATRLHGISLAQQLSEGGPLPLETALQLSLDLLDGLAAMHDRGLVHRDVKPSNLLVENGRGALCDLGIAMSLDEVTREWQAGTPGYLPPELTDGGNPEPDRRSDVWAAAMTISRMIGDRAPHPIDHLIHAVAASERRRDRPADARELAGRLLTAIREAGLHLDSERDAGSPTTQRRRTAVWASGAAAALLAASLLGATVARALPGRRLDTSTSLAALAAVRVLPDISPGSRPMLRDARKAGRCDGRPLPGGAKQQRAGGRVIAEVRLYFDERGQACAKLVKTPAGGLHNQRTYLALTLCNPQGLCDYDWNRYRIDAGPVKISAVDGCVAWRVSALDGADMRWLLRDEVGSAGCAR